MRKKFKNFVKALLLSSVVFGGGGGATLLKAQAPQEAKIAVTGVVSDADGPIIGAGVTEKGNPGNGVATDIDGKYSLRVSPNATIAVAYLGYSTQEVPVNGQTTINVTLAEDAANLDEVVVVGYGIASKGGTPFGAKVTVKSDRLNIPLTSIDKALQGNVAGVQSLSNSGQPGAGQQVVVRGVGTINGGTTPLYVVDGIPIASGSYGSTAQTTATSMSGDNLNALSSLNPNDIESITILKDAASTSIYGSRASNGVVYITTKQGKAGKTQFNVKLSTGFSSRTSNKLKTLNKDQYIDYITEARANAGFNDGTVEVAGKQVNKFIADQFKVRNADGDFYDFDWIGAAYNDNAPITTADFTASGGTERTKFFLGLSALDQDGIVLDTYLKRYTGRLNLDHTVNNNVKMGANLALSYSDQFSPMTTGSFLINPVNASALHSPLEPGIIGIGSTLSDGTPLEPGPNINYMSTTQNGNFLASSAYDDFSSRTARSTTSGYVQWSFLDGFTLKGIAGYDYFYLTEEEWRDARPRGTGGTGHGMASSTITEQLSWNETVTLNYIKTISDSHNLNILLGQEAQSEGYRYALGEKMDFAGSYSHYMSQGATPSNAAGERFASSLASFFGTANYNYDQKYFLSASLRGDGSSRLSKDNRWSTFWSTGFSWYINKEEFLNRVDIIDNLNLRASYGTTGNQSGIDRYAALALYSGVEYNGEAGLFPSQVENPNLTWEKTTSLDIGIDVAILKNRLSATIDWYNRDTKEALLNSQLSRATGFSSLIANVGELTNSGIEIALNGTPVRTNNIEWTAGFNITSNTNKITKLYEGAEIISLPPYGIYREGEDLQSFYTYRWAGVNPADGSPMYYDNDGEIMRAYNENGDTRRIVGSAAPKFYGGFNTKILAYGVDLSLGFYYTYGNKIYDNSWINLTGSGSRNLYNQFDVITNRWKKEGDIAAYPKPYYGYPQNISYATTDKSVFDGSYLRLRDVTLGYTLPHKFIKPTGLQNVRIYAQGTNLLTFTKFPDLDPEVGGGKNAGYYHMGYPNARTVTFGLDVKF
ncbi:SusC/RagA family TonB-linked outer membrane protein [Candidatus Symbiothrix dinenymphae]|uniref:SusC/RagA family TonB-linked outer membrane protein n=1 Tax=Candidatus Symbiothrix dinenymphae TaxID=467085 RepID=UPI000B0B14BB|nr:TonB-dependent receptor [Candidatus Symbiothrix dinenymphae]